MPLAKWYHPLMMEVMDATTSGDPRRIRALQERIEVLLSQTPDLSDFERTSLQVQVAAFDKILAPRLAPGKE